MHTNLRNSKLAGKLIIFNRLNTRAIITSKVISVARVVRHIEEELGLTNINAIGNNIIVESTPLNYKRLLELKTVVALNSGIWPIGDTGEHLLVKWY